MRGLGWMVAVLALFGAAGVRAAPVHPAHRPATATPAARRNWAGVVVPTPEGGMRMGDPAAPVKLVEYGSRTCPTCARFDAEGVPALVKAYVATGQVSYEFRDYPVHGAMDLAPILLGRCVAPARYFPLLRAMMAGQPALIGRGTQIPDADQERLSKASPPEVATYLGKFYGYLDLATQHGLPEARARACLSDQAAIDAIARRANAAGQYVVKGTPTFVVNGKPVADVYRWSDLEPVLKAAGAR